jgi:O-antigen/teichoic acid export membrane protein
MCPYHPHHPIGLIVRSRSCRVPRTARTRPLVRPAEREPRLSPQEALAEVDAEAIPEPELSPDEVVRGAVRGSVLIMVRTLGGQLVGFLASIAIARLVAPSAFGQFTIAAAIQQAGSTVIFMGLPASLIRQPASPTTTQQQAVAGFTMALASATAGAAALVAFGVLPILGSPSTTAEVIAIACIALPVFSIRVIPMVLLRRRLLYERLLTAEVTAQLTFHFTAVPAAFLGFGAYGLAAAVPISALVSTIVVSRLQPWSRGYSLDLSVIRELAGFGAGVGLFRILTVVQEVGLVSLFAAIGGQALAGFYGMSRRILGLPYGAVRSVQGVGFPALARLQREEARLAQTARATAVSATAVGLLLAILVGAGEPLVATLFGERWAPTVEIITLSSVGLMLFASMGGLISSLALADGDTRSPVIAVLSQIVATIGLAIVTVPSLDEVGVGIAVGGGYTVFTAVLFLTRAPTEVRASSGRVLRAIVVAALAAGAGRVLSVGNDIAGLVEAVAASGGTWLLLAWALTRTELKLIVTLLRTHLGRGRQEDEAASAPSSDLGASP